MSSPAPLSEALPDFAAPTATNIADQLQRAQMLSSATHQAAVERARNEELSAARAAGLADGLAQAGAESTRTMAEVGAALARSEQQVREAVRDSLTVDAATLVDIAAALAEWVIGRELLTDPAALTGQLSAVLTTVASGTAVDVAVHPKTLTAYQAWAATAADHDVTVTADPNVALGEAVARTSGGGLCRVGAADALRRAVAALTDTSTAQETLG